MARILWINPVGTDAYDAPIGAELRAESVAPRLLAPIPVVEPVLNVDPR